MGIIEWLDSALQDARYGLRQLRRTPALALAVVLSLAIGLGANTAIFSLVDAAHPEAAAGRTIRTRWSSSSGPTTDSRRRSTNHNGEYTPDRGRPHQARRSPRYLYRRLAREQTVFEALIGIGAYPDAVAIAAGYVPRRAGEPAVRQQQLLPGARRSPVLGRPFRDDEDRVGEEPVVIVSHRFWVSRLGAAATRWIAASASTTCPLASSASPRPGSSASGPASGPTSTRRSR